MQKKHYIFVWDQKEHCHYWKYVIFFCSNSGCAHVVSSIDKQLRGTVGVFRLMCKMFRFYERIVSPLEQLDKLCTDRCAHEQNGWIVRDYSGWYPTHTYIYIYRHNCLESHYRTERCRNIYLIYFSRNTHMSNSRFRYCEFCKNIFSILWNVTYEILNLNDEYSIL